MPAPRRGIEVVMIVAAAALGAATVDAAAAPVPRAKEMDARRAFAAGEWKQALQLFADLYAETLHPVYLRNIGRCHQKLRDPERAIDAFRDYLAKSKQVSREERAEIDGYIAEMEALQESRRAERDRQGISASKPEAAAAPPLARTEAPVAPDLSPRPPPAGPSLQLTDPATAGAEPPVYRRWWFWAGIGALVVGGVVAAIVLNSSAGDRCPAGVDCAGAP
jgi:hypothetical protein